jgi:hypothetical protein
MNYLALVKQIGWDKLAGVVVRVVVAVVEAMVKLVTRRKPETVAPADGVRVTVLSISTETISISSIVPGDEDLSGPEGGDAISPPRSSSR